ncbi:hypothetical protein ABL78_6184 [Leptomonas seymouri]|uniref:TATA element modulatory factor 1 TATA binding domain-containing protein n=1 Tax=Leptomonas seymouri TaxID=5684 RepID=A0A0N0P412_LEPSE|nr:hypothetical protein ABL78_6184 [Leptomonas seymouri]|eukprot:KPI84766.1 hypothetical protein ABL78_6184 [Leptomonas seymouri]
MSRSDNNGKVDVALRLRRAWSAPAAPLSYIRVGRVAPPCILTPDSNGSRSGVNAAAEGQTLPRAVYHLFPTQTSFPLVDIAYGADAPKTNKANATASTSFAAVPIPSQDVLKAELQAAKNQISLLTAASTQSFGSYVALESENVQLKQANEQLREEIDALRERLAQRDDEISEQLRLICDLEKRLEEFSSFTLSNKSSCNGQGHD